MSTFILIMMFLLGGLIGILIGAGTEFDWKAYFEYRLKRDEMYMNKIEPKEVTLK